MPEAAVDIAKILQLLSAMEKGSLERYEGKTLEEIEIEDELPPDLESDKPDGDNEEAESSVQSSGVSSPRRSISSTKNKGLPVRKCGRPRKRRPESESEECDQCEEKKTEEAEETLSRSKEEETNVYFSDDDDDYMNVNFDLDIDTDDGDGNYENDKNGNSVGLALPPVITNVKETANQKKDDGDSKKKDSSPNKRTTDREAEETGDAEAEKQDEQMDVNRSSSSAILDAGVSSSRRSISSTKNKGLSVRKRGRPRKRRLVSEDEKSGLCEGKNENTPEENETEDMPVLKAEETLSRSKEDATDVYFSDDDDDYMNVDFDLDIDADEDDGNCKKDKDGDSVGLASTPVIGDVKETANQKKDISTKKDSSPNERTTDTENVPTDPMDVDSSSSSAILDAEKKNQLSAVLTGMKELKILIPKLNIENIQGPIHISLLPSVCRRLPVNDQPVQNNSNKCENTSPSTDVNNKSSDAKDIEMMCSYCKKCMTKGHTAYQKKGFKDVFCSKNCLFEMFPMNGQTTKTCHYCLKSITQLLDLIMAVVDVKGTMKDFCSATCLICFKSTTGSAQAAQLLCSMCNKSCTTTCELTLNAAVHKFCSDSCLEDFRRDRNAVCENCKSPCLENLVLKLEGEPKTVCTERCLQHFKENIKTPAPCTLCHTYQPVPDMVVYKSSSDTMELFCSRNCVVSYRLGSALLHKLQGKKDPDQLKKKKRGMEMKQTLNSEDGNIRSDSTSSCPSERNPEIRLVNKTCYNCFQVVLRPHSIILAPVDDLGTMKELCSETCLASVNSRRSMAATKPSPPLGPQLDCRICNRYCYCKFRLTLEGTVHGLCSDTCLTIFRKANNVPLLTCDVCSSIHLDRQFELKMEDGIKNICSEECLVKFKEKVAKAQLCLMCQTSHQMSDMVENKNEEGSLSFFCSNRCMKVHQASFLTGTEKSKPSSEENEVKEVKPSPHFNIKEEPIDDEYNQKLSPSISMLDIKREPNAGKEDLKISSIFSLTEDSKPAAATFPHDDFHASCSNCKNILMDGETVYQRKGHTDVFCSTSCLFKFYQMKPVKKTCHFCLETITQPQDVVQAPVDSDGTTKGFCSQTCLSSFNYKKMMSTRMPIVPVGSHSQCNTCGRYSITKHEFIHNDRVYKMCSESCLNRFCNLNKLSICENCNSCCKNLFMLKVEHGNKKVCSAECLAHFKKKVKANQPCAMCRAPKLISEMVENKNSKDEVELYCTNSCLMASKIQAISASGSPLSCDNCSKTTVPACHLAMSDDSMRNFCSLTCAMAFKETQKEKIAATNSTGVPDQTRLQPPEKLLCAQCQSVIGTTPKVIQKKDKVSFVCSLACSQKFKRDNNMTGMCAFCKNQRIITDTKRIDGKDCYFCSDGCKMLYREKLEMSSGRQCCQCAYCHSISTTVVTAKYDDKEETFCSEDCSSHFKMLVYCVAKCDTCGQGGKLRQYLPMLGHVKHFCDLKCLLHFCNKKAQVVDTGAPPPGSSSAVDSCPVIANVISLASALGRCSTVRSSPAHNGSVPDIQTKVVGHASVQTVPKELKNKSVLCTPLVHNKGVCCTTQTVDSEAQTDDFVPRVLPVPVPVYVPLPMNMYSQYTPKPVGLPLLLPVPVFFPVTSVGPEAAVKERIQPETSEGKSGMEITLKDEREGGQEGREMVKEGKRREYQTLTEHTSSCSRDLEKEDSNSFKNQEETCPNTTHTSHSLQHTDKESPLVSGVDVACEPQPGPPPPAAPHSHSLPSPPPAPPLQILGDVDNKSELQQMSKAGNEASLEHSKVMSRKQHKLKSQSGVDAWKRWIQWRTSKAEVGPSHAVKLKENMLHYSAAELSSSLCCFIKEVKRPDGKSYSPSSLFFLCLSIQQYLFENGRMENIFSDLTYTAFSTEFTKILKHFKPPVKTPGYIHSRVEEEYLWDCKQLGAYSPIVLLNTLLFFCCKYFGFATVERHRHLSFAHISRRTKTTSNNTKTTFLRFYLPVSVNEAEPDADGVPAKRRKKNENTEDFLEMMENTKNPLRCPVRLYEFYLSKCPESVRQHRDLFYLQPDRCCSPTSPLWFSSTPLDDSTMEAMLLRILTVRQLREGKGERRENSLALMVSQTCCCFKYPKNCRHGSRESFH
ncbi:hypothetical protein Q5P01_018653 [Channa striata]|uniref:TRASH domain-containing protein n=1 Tax=Channa striata TaxID=64152 RepID=A0AA88SA19_CHASR|nr:hypothetical protein Q5P01_018653 [Channa striata]